MADGPGLLEIHRVLTNALKLVESLTPTTSSHLSADTAYALGRAEGALSHAKAMVGRDLDDLKATQSTT